MWTFHGLTPVEYVSGFRDRWLMRIRKRAYISSMKRAELIKVDSRFVKNEVVQWGIDPSKVIVMPLGIDLSRMSGGDGRRVRDKYGVGDRFLLLYVGRLVKFKHMDELIRAVAMLEEVCLMVAGGGPDRERLEALSKSLDVGGRVWFAGRVADGELPDYYAACDAWATASRHEGFCVPVVEAMAAGKPSIVPDVAAVPETAGDAGLIYPAGDVASLAEKIRTLSADKELYAKLSSIAKARAPSFEMSGVMEWYVEMVKEFYSPTKSYEMTKRQGG
jgi:glycosyltransferase involved in cell wall biosynthesis